MPLHRMSILLLCLVLVNCKKDDDSETSSSTTSENLKNPVGALELAAGIMQSAGTTIGENKNASLRLDAGEWTTETHCNDGNGEPLAQTGEDKSPGQETLINTHPRRASQHFYCMMQQDTGNTTTFVGTITSTKLYACFVSEEDLNFTGEAVVKNVKGSEVRTCWKKEFGFSDAEMDEMLAKDAEAEVTITSNSPAEFGGEGWDASITVEASGLGEDVAKTQFLLKDSDEKFGLAIISNSGRTELTDAARVGIDYATGEIWFEGKAQRLRVYVKDDSSTGWNNSSVGYVKGTMDEDYQFTAVDKYFGAFSKIGYEGESTTQDGLTYGEFWTVNGLENEDMAHAYQLECDSGTCSDANLAASWSSVSADANGSCNGAVASESGSCTPKGVELEKDTQTGFVLDPEHSTYETTDTWFKSVGFPAFTSLELTAFQK